MAEVNRDEMLAELSAGAVQWSQWRATRKVGTRIPEPLWELAVELARKYGVSRTAATLRVSYDVIGASIPAIAGRNGQPGVRML